MSSERPVDLPLVGLFAAMPVTAVGSILHRITGIVLFVGVFYLCYLLDLALRDSVGFREAAAVVDSALGKFALWLVLASLGYHLIAGLRHLLMDFHVGDSLRAARIGAWTAMGLSALAAVLLAVWLW